MFSWTGTADSLGFKESLSIGSLLAKALRELSTFKPQDVQFRRNGYAWNSKKLEIENA
jgi:hypothetical protein